MAGRAWGYICSVRMQDLDAAMPVAAEWVPGAPWLKRRSRISRCPGWPQAATITPALLIAATQMDNRMPRSYRYYDLILGAFVCVLLCANLIGPAKIAHIGGFTFGAGVLFFPISYLFGDILTEVYGYARAGG